MQFLLIEIIVDSNARLDYNMKLRAVQPENAPKSIVESRFLERNLQNILIEYWQKVLECNKVNDDLY